MLCMGGGLLPRSAVAAAEGRHCDVEKNFGCIEHPLRGSHSACRCMKTGIFACGKWTMVQATQSRNVKESEAPAKSREWPEA